MPLIADRERMMRENRVLVEDELSSVEGAKGITGGKKKKKGETITEKSQESSLRARKVQSHKRQLKDLNSVRCHQEVKEEEEETSPDHSLDVHIRSSSLMIKKEVPVK